MSTDWAEAGKESEFTAQATSGERSIAVSLSGTADLTVKNRLDRFLREVHAEAQRCLVEEVTVDVRRLEFVNSSCLKCFVWWIGTVQEQTGDGKYRIVFVSSPQVDWQRRSLNALACLASEIITIRA
jgi:hypothetical protein